jgi:membrane fusion protein (multidrug efflux system)
MNARALAVFGSTLWIAACHKGAAPQPPAPTVQVTEVIQQDVAIYREWVGTLDGFVNAEIRPQVTGYIQKQVFKEGTVVQEGDLLFLIDPRNYKDSADQAKSTLDRNIASLAKARLDVQRDKELIAAQAITRQQYDNDLAAEREAAASVAQSRASLSQAQLSHGWTRVTSPISGIAGIVQVQVGDLVSTTTTMTTVSRVDPIKAQFNISEVEYLHSVQGNHWVEAGESAEPTLQLILADGSVYSKRGVVIVINRQVNQQTGTIAVQGSFPNPGNVLRPGQYGKVRAAINTRKNALLVPQRAIIEVQGASQVGVVGSDGKMEIRVVKTAEQVGPLMVIENGLSAGDKVIVSDLTRLRPGMPVRAVPATDNTTASAEPATGGSSPRGP